MGPNIFLLGKSSFFELGSNLVVCQCLSEREQEDLIFCSLSFSHLSFSPQHFELRPSIKANVCPPSNTGQRGEGIEKEKIFGVEIL